MFHQRDRAKESPRSISPLLLNAKYVILTSLTVVNIANNSLVFAHKVEIAENVGATLHIQPNDNPRAGEASLAWFALTRKGGKVIPLSECNCELSVYEVGSTAALVVPPLKGVAAEGYQGIPGAEITFPKEGAYQLQLSGKPKSEANFKPFELKFDVTVAAGAAIGQPSPSTAQLPGQVEQPAAVWQIPLIAVSTMIAIALFWVVSKRR